MAHQIDLSTADKPVREFIENLSPLTQPVEIISSGRVIAKLVAPTELSEAEKQRILDEGWSVVKKARRNMRSMTAGAIQSEVDKALTKVRARRDHNHES